MIEGDIVSAGASEAASGASHDVLSEIFDAAQVGLCLLDAAGYVVRANDEWLRSTGLEREAALGQHVWRLFPDTPESIRRLHDRARAGATTAVPPHSQERHGREVWYEGWLAPVRMRDGTGILITALDITQRRRAEDALRDGMVRMRLLVDANPIGVVEGDADGRILDANDAYLRIIGRTRDDLRAGIIRWDALTPREHLAADARAIAEARERGVSSVYEKEYVRSDGQRVPVLIACATIGRSEGLVAFIVDLTERKRAEAALREANDQLRAAARHKDEFLATLSHELRNPLAPIRHSMQILRLAAPGSGQARRAHDVIERQAAHLARLVDDLLDVTRIASGKIELRRARVDLRDVAARAADDFRAAMEERGVTLRCDVPPGCVWVDVDATRVTQLIGNLLHNAAKFSRRDDEVTVSVAAVRGDAEISVRDSGAGIDPALLPRVFEAFVQGERTLARSDGGLGLGLALVKGLAELHGGTVRAESAGIGRGATFVVRLPLAPAPQVSEAPRRLRPRAAAHRRVLVVDDNRDAALSLAELLELLGHTADVAFDGPSAIEKARAHPPHVVLCDIGLPGVTGYDVARALRSDGRPVQLVALTGYAQADDVRAAIEAGFDAHLAKPCDPADIERLIE